MLWGNLLPYQEKYCRKSKTERLSLVSHSYDSVSTESAMLWTIIVHIYSLPTTHYEHRLTSNAYTDWEPFSPSQSPAYYRVPPHKDSPRSLLSLLVTSVLSAHGLTAGNPHRIQIDQCSSWHRERLSSTPHHPRGLHLLRGRASFDSSTTHITFQKINKWNRVQWR